MTTPDERAPIDWLRVERWATQVLAGDDSELRGAFAATEPKFLWNPEPEALASDKLRFLLNYWNELKRGAASPRSADIDPIAMRPVLGYVMLLEPVDDHHDFRFRVFGSAIASVSEFELTGRLASELIASAAVIEFGLATYHAVFRRNAPLYTVRFPTGARYTAAWHRLTLPLVDNDGSVERLIAASVPLSSEGTLVR